jgi:hypothetical protein
MAMGFTAFAPKWTALFWLWAVVNLFFTCLSEEAFFRGFVQAELAGPDRVALPQPAGGERQSGRGVLAGFVA